MGLFDIFKKKAKDALNQVQGESAPVPQAPAASPAAAAPQAATAPTGPTFEYDGDVYPLPQGWDGLSIEDWFFKLESIRDHLMHADEENLQPMTDEDGDELDAEEILLITKYGFKTGGHFEAFRNWGVYNWARQTGESPTDVEFRMSTIAREKMMGDKAGAMAGPGGAMEPVEGVALEQWAKLQAAIASGGDANALAGQAGIDPDRWQRVSAEWNARMSTDTSGAIATAYGNAFAGGGQFGAAGAQAAAAGTAGDVGAEPIPFERFVEIQEAVGAAANRGEDPNAMLAQFGINAADWGNLGMYWNKRIAQEATKYHALFTEYSAKYKAKYGG